jgi:hypothetical protein
MADGHHLNEKIRNILTVVLVGVITSGTTVSGIFYANAREGQNMSHEWG